MALIALKLLEWINVFLTFWPYRGHKYMALLSLLMFTAAICPNTTLAASTAVTTIEQT